MNSTEPIVGEPVGVAAAAAGLHRLVEAQAARTPDAPALLFAAQSLTCRTLNARANGLAVRLRELGVEADSAVGVCVDRGPDAIVTVLGVMKAGGACVPLDPSYPPDRLAYMLADSDACVIVTDRPDAPSAPGVIAIHPADSAPQDANLDGPSDPASLAYIIYTSGSTGRPKGVEMPHGPILNLAAWHARACPLTPGARVLQFAPLSFDVSFQEIFTTLGEGGTLVLIPEALRLDPRGLLQHLAASGVARMFLPPVMLHQVAEQRGYQLLPALREVIVAGEALRITPTVVRFFQGLGEGATLSNHYGPSETHVVTAHTLSGAPERWPALPPIGRPISNVRLQLLPVEGHPEGSELYVSGACLARGYRNNPLGNADRFANGAYRTGDLVQLLPDGDLQFLGRADDQVKIRGFRVELGEIETALSHHPAIEANAVIAAPNASGQQELIGYLVPRAPHPAPAPAELRRWLLERVPDYLAPAHFVVLDKLPLTASGKIDRRALPRYQPPAASAVNSSVQSPLERIIARLWEETLGLATPGLRDNFFEVGGNSVLAVQVHTKLCQALGREFPITDLFQHPTIAALARHLGAAPDTAARLDPMRERARRQQEQQRQAAERRTLAARR